VCLTSGGVGHRRVVRYDVDPPPIRVVGDHSAATARATDHGQAMAPTVSGVKPGKTEAPETPKRRVTTSVSTLR